MNIVEIKIEKGIPVAPFHNSKHGCTKYPFDRMEVGDSFFIECDRTEAKSVRSAMQRTKDRHAPKNFVSRYLKTGLRVWRIT